MNPDIFLSEDHTFHSRELHQIDETHQAPKTEIFYTVQVVSHIETVVQDKVKICDESLFFTEGRLNF